MNLEEYERMYQAEETQWWYAGMRAISFRLLDGVSSGSPRILDAGCGTGNNVSHLSRLGQAVGIDLSEEALRFCRLRDVAVARAAIGSLPFPDGVFGLVTSFDVLYHRWVVDDRAALRELARVLRPGGVLLLRVPALRLLWGAHDEAVHSRHRYTTGEVRRLLGEAGLAPLRVSYANTLLFPLILVRRLLDRITGRQGSDVSFLPAPLERIFRSLLLAEAWWLSRRSLPVGASVFGLARKPLYNASGMEAMPAR